MERALSQDERIRRAEEVYARRQNTRERTRHATVNISEPKNFKLFKRVALQAVICVLLYFIFYLINTTNYSFSSATLNKTNELLSNDFDFISVFNNIKESINSYIYSLQNDNQIQDGTSENQVQNEINIDEVFIEEGNSNNNDSENQKEEAQIVKDESVDISILNNDDEVSAEQINNVELSETDRIKQIYSFILPVKRLDFI